MTDDSAMGWTLLIFAAVALVGASRYTATRNWSRVVICVGLFFLELAIMLRQTIINWACR